MLTFDSMIYIKEKYMTLKHKEENEQIVLEIINKSNYIFNDIIPFKHIKKQDNTESDFICRSGYTLDAKIILPKSFWQIVAVKNDLSEYSEVFRYFEYFNNWIAGIDIFFKVEEDKKIIESIESIEKSIVRALKHSKNVIVFFPFPTLKFKDSFTSILAVSPLEHWLSELIKKHKNKNNDFYFLTYTVENRFLLYEFNKQFLQEYIDHDFSEYMIFQFKTFIKAKNIFI